MVLSRPKRKPVYSNQLNKRVEVWERTMVENELGEQEYQDQKSKTVWACIVPQTGTMGNRVGTEFASMTHKIITRCATGREIKNTSYFKFCGRRFEILYALNPYEENVIIEFFTREVVE